MRGLVFLLCVALSGCHGPLVRPMVERLDEEHQQVVDSAWLNMLTPPDRLDRTLLLDVLLTHYLFQMGVDRLDFVSQKWANGLCVVMEVHFERDRPEADEFVVTFWDEFGNEVRCERYSRQDVDDRCEFLFGPLTADHEIIAEDDETRREIVAASEAARAARIEEIIAATQPAVPR